MRRLSIEARGGQSSERFMPRRRIMDSTGCVGFVSGFIVLRALCRGLKLSAIQGGSNAI
jgi:hypothetical protein